jgi:hypothetical protein
VLRVSIDARKKIFLVIYLFLQDTKCRPSDISSFPKGTYAISDHQIDEDMRHKMYNAKSRQNGNFPFHNKTGCFKVSKKLAAN